MNPQRYMAGIDPAKEDNSPSVVRVYGTMSDDFERGENGFNLIAEFKARSQEDLEKEVGRVARYFQPAYIKPKEQAQSWVEQFEKSFKQRWDGHMIELEQIFWGIHPTQKQQHMTPISINDPKLIDRITACMRTADEAFETSGGSTKHYVRDVLLPILQREGLRFCTDAPLTPLDIHDPELARTFARALNRSGEIMTDEQINTLMNVVFPTLKFQGIGFYSVPVHRPEPIQSPIMDYPKTPAESHRLTTKGNEETPYYTKEDAKAFTPGYTHGYPTYRFGMAVEFLEIGKKMARAGWNGKNMFVYYVPAASYPPMTEVAKSTFGENLVPYNPYFAIKNVDGTVSTWVPSVNDCLAKDWYIVE